MEQPIWNYEQEPYEESPDETTINLRAHFDRMPDEKMQQYNPAWTDEELIAWAGDFTEDGSLLLPCCERDVEVDEYRAVLTECMKYRDRVRPQIVGR